MWEKYETTLEETSSSYAKMIKKMTSNSTYGGYGGYNTNISIEDAAEKINSELSKKRIS